MRLKVEILVPGLYEDSGKKLVGLIMKSEFLQLVKAGEKGDVRAYLIPPGTTVRKGDPLPKLKIFDRPAWAVTGHDDELIMPIRSIDEAGAVKILFDNLEKFAFYVQKKALTNPYEKNPLRGKIEFILKKRRADGTWEIAESDKMSGKPIFNEADRISCEIINHHDSTIFVSILDFGLTCSVEYLPSGKNIRMGSGESINIGAHDHETLELTFPPGFPYAPDQGETYSYGVETFKLFATTFEADFSPLLQPDFQKIASMEKNAEELLDMVLQDSGKHSYIDHKWHGAEWITIERPFFLKRRTGVLTRTMDKKSRTIEPLLHSEVVTPQKQIRFIQAQVFENVHGKLHRVDGFVHSMQYIAKVRIGPKDNIWLTPDIEFPDHLLPVMEKNILQVFFSEPNHTPQVQTATIELWQTGPSAECQFSFSVNKQIPVFEGRIIVAHKNRVLQTALLKGEVVESLENANEPSIRLEIEAVLRPIMEGLSAREKFDLALIVNKSGDDRHRLTKLADDRASIRDIEGIQIFIRNIQERLENAAREIADSENAEAGTLRSSRTVALLGFLAYQGGMLYQAIIADQVDAAWLPRHPGRIQLVSAHAEAYLPIEFLYEKPIPGPDAKLCPKAEEALKQGLCKDCLIENETARPKYFCPAGFWCLNRVIERHAHDPSYGALVGYSDHVIQTEPVENRNILNVLRNCLYAASDRVDSVVPGQRQKFFQTLNSVSNNSGVMVSMWDDWAREVAAKHPTLLVLMPHTLEDETLRTPAMEIGSSDRLNSGFIRPDYVCSSRGDQAPLVALLGCETLVPYNKYMGFVPQFRRNGAALVLCTLTTVLGRHVVPIAEKLVEELREELNSSDDHGVLFGDVLLHLRRKALMEGLPIVLCLIAFGDADWRLGR